jgi:hypothetical protein
VGIKEKSSALKISVQNRGKLIQRWEMEGFLGLTMRMQMDLKNNIESLEEIFLFDPFNIKSVEKC